MGLKAKNKNTKVVLADPMGAALYSYYKTGELKSEGSSITEGIGQSRITANLEGIEVDDAWRIDDADALRTIFALTKEEGMCLGGSSGINIAGAIAMAKKLGETMDKYLILGACSPKHAWQAVNAFSGWLLISLK